MSGRIFVGNARRSFHSIKKFDNSKGAFSCFLSRNASSWFSSKRSISLEDLKDDGAKLDAIRGAQKSDPISVIKALERGWGDRTIPISEPFVKEYLRSAMLSNRIDSVNLSALSAMLVANSTSGRIFYCYYSLFCSYW